MFLESRQFGLELIDLFAEGIRLGRGDDRWRRRFRLGNFDGH